MVTFKGKPVTLTGKQPEVGQKAPDFKVLSQDMEEFTLSNFEGKNLLVNVILSVDTGICDEQIHRFQREVAKMGNMELITISADLPFALSKFCSAKDIETKIFSDHRDMNFATNYGVFVKELRVLSRGIFIIDSEGILRYKQIVPEIGSHPDYETALKEARKIAG